MIKSNMLLKIEARTRNILQALNQTDSETSDTVLLSTAEVQEELNAIETEPIVAQFTKELQQAIDTVSKETLPYEAISYEWYYDRYDLENPAIGKAYEKCSHRLLSNANTGPDNSWMSMSINKPTLSGEILDLNRLSVSLITRVWYNLIARSEQKHTHVTNDMYDNMQMVLFDELFKLKLFTLLDAAYTNVTGNKPEYFSVGIYGYWHTEITEYRIEPQGTGTLPASPFLL